MHDLSTVTKPVIVVTGLVVLVALAPAAVRWYHRRGRIVRSADGFFVQHASHLLMVAHHLLVLLLLLDVQPFRFLPCVDGTACLGPTGSAAPAALGLVLWLIGNYVRIRAIYVLGKSFDKSVSVQEDHQLVTGGPFRFSRHPVYWGNLVSELGLGLALVSWPLIAFTLLLSFPVLNYRAGREEKLLRDHFGTAYEAYCRRVGRWF